MVCQGGHNDPLIPATTAGLTLPLPRKLEQARSLLLVNLTLGRVARAVTKCSRRSDDEDNSRRRWPFVGAEIGLLALHYATATTNDNVYQEEDFRY